MSGKIIDRRSHYGGKRRKKKKMELVAESPIEVAPCERCDYFERERDNAGAPSIHLHRDKVTYPARSWEVADNVGEPRSGYEKFSNGEESLKTMKRVIIAFCEKRETTFDREVASLERRLENEKDPMEGSIKEESVAVPCEKKAEVDKQWEDATETFLDEPMERLDEEKLLNGVLCEEQVLCEDPKVDENHGEGSDQATKIEKENDEDVVEEMAVDVDDGVGSEEAKGSLEGKEIQKNDQGDEEDNKMHKDPKEEVGNNEEKLENDQGRKKAPYRCSDKIRFICDVGEEERKKEKQSIGKEQGASLKVQRMSMPRGGGAVNNRSNRKKKKTMSRTWRKIRGEDKVSCRIVNRGNHNGGKRRKKKMDLVAELSIEVAPCERYNYSEREHGNILGEKARGIGSRGSKVQRDNEKEPMEGSVKEEPVVVPCEEKAKVSLEEPRIGKETFLDEPMERLDEEKVIDDVPCEEKVPCEEDHGEGSKQAAKIEKENDEDAMEEMVVDVDDGVGSEEAKGALEG
eukprot:Gb_20956 [translate_table: standard]